MNQLLLIQSLQPSEMDGAMLHLAEWMGIERIHITNPSRFHWTAEIEGDTRHGPVCVAASADALAHISEASDIVHALSRLAAERPVRVLLYGIGSSSSHLTLLKRLGCCSIDGVQHLQKQPVRYKFAAEDKAWLRQLAGLEFSDESGVGCDVFTVAHQAEDQVVPFLFVEEHPVFLRTSAARGPLELYLWATSHIADVGAPISRGTGPESMYQWLLPAILYLKNCFGSSCWHNPNVRARLIIDDPLLRLQYGFLRYDELLDSMRRVPYGTSLAFIPWNYGRSQEQVAALFQANSNRLSLCIHGCDHTNHEFDSEDEEHLTRIARLALQRMELHHERQGVSHEQIMVFPQGHFSSIALRALRTSGFVAAVNSSCSPGREAAKLPLGDFMLPAVCRFHGFPIFLRRDPDRIIDIAVDLFLGRAGLLVEHHEFVRDGYDQWEHFAERMNALDERLSWGPLLETITETCWQKMAGDSETHIRLFTPVFQWTNPLDRPMLARFSKLEPEPELIKEIRVNGQITPFHVAEGYVHFEAVVKGQASTRLEIVDKKTELASPFRPSLGHQLRVGSRRVLSEFRDNTLVRHPKWLGHARSIARHLKLTGDSR